MIKGSTAIGYGHPSLIYYLCVQTRAVDNPDEEVILHRAALTKHLIKGMGSKMEVEERFCMPLSKPQTFKTIRD